MHGICVCIYPLHDYILLRDVLSWFVEIDEGGTQNIRNETLKTIVREKKRKKNVCEGKYCNDRL